MAPGRRTRSGGIAAAALAALALTGPAAAAQPGSLDRGFGVEGIVAIDPPGMAFDPRATETIAGGATLVGGIASGITYPSTAYGNPVLLKYRHDGTPDAAFGDQGVAVVDVGAPFSLHAMDVDPSGGTVLSGSVQGEGLEEDRGALVRIDRDGSLDRGFGSNGLAVVDYGAASEEGLGDVAIQPDGAIVTAGSDSVDHPKSTPSATLTRFTPGGTLDSSFMNGGRGSPSASWMTSLALTPALTAAFGTYTYWSRDPALVGVAFGHGPVAPDAGRVLAGGTPRESASATDATARPDGTFVVLATMSDPSTEVASQRLFVFDAELTRRASAKVPYGASQLGVDGNGDVLAIDWDDGGDGDEELTIQRLRGTRLKLDRSFGRDGGAVHELAGYQVVADAAVQADGATLVLTERPRVVIARREQALLYRFHGGEDGDAPRIAVTPGRVGCVRGRRLLRVRVRDSSVLDRVTVRGAVRVDRQARAFTLRVPARVTAAAGRRVTVTATDEAGNTSRVRRTVRRC